MVPLRWSPARIGQAVRRRADPDCDPREAAILNAVLFSLTRYVPSARSTLEALLAEHRDRLPQDDYTFENLAAGAVACRQFDLAAEICNVRFGAAWCAGIGVDPRPSSHPAVLWTVLPDGTARFDFCQALFRSDRILTDLLFWARSLSLYHAYTTSEAPQAGAVHVNLFDVGVIPGLSPSDDKPGCFLVPDPLFLSSRGYEATRAEFDRADVPWEARRPCAFWRGSTTGHVDDDWLTMQRVRLCELARREHARGLIDAGLTGTAQMTDAWAAEIRGSGLMRDLVPRTDYLRYRYQIDVDGNSNAWAGLFERLYSGSPVLKVESRLGYRQWYYDRLEPWRHFVPVEADMSDLAEKVDWLRRNDAVAQEIGRRGKALAASLRDDEERRRSFPTIAAAIRHRAGLPLTAADDVRFLSGFRPSADGARWTGGPQSRIKIRAPAVAGGMILRLAVRAPAGPCRLEVVVNDERVFWDAVAGAPTLDCALPEALLRRRSPLSVTLLHPEQEGIVIEDVSLRLADPAPRHG